MTIALVAAAIAAGGLFAAPPAQADHDPETLPIDIDGWARTPAPTIALEEGYAANGIIYTQEPLNLCSHLFKLFAFDFSTMCICRMQCVQY
ncbi:MAG: hypothetical protein IIC96_19280 [Chloroflexi bacterium]|nr:hypothetical protein [Chloroflexota bacterium]